MSLQSLIHNNVFDSTNDLSNNSLINNNSGINYYYQSPEYIRLKIDIYKSEIEKLERLLANHQQQVHSISNH